MEYTEGQWLRQHLSDLVHDVIATERSDQPLFNKGLDVKCAIDAKLEIILNHKESAPALYEALKEQADYTTSIINIAGDLDEITRRVILMHIYSILELRDKALALAKGRE
ncbi:hypothetical protein LCGC14_0543650 [marine sediment metagenome]|uniref:Uncharacterized protein n=1 Tax=marine sediment metagenome TaxID=412755 RepID=A0A0F9UDH8_9ZZZZ